MIPQELQDTQISISLQHNSNKLTSARKLQRLIRSIFPTTSVNLAEEEEFAVDATHVSAFFPPSPGRTIWIFLDDGDTIQDVLNEGTTVAYMPSFAEFKRQIGVS